ncbi:hypothetical protein [Cohnella nanjingensis]|uniref:Uncharacterized protein n=1 Tax=Cohnella nanjingensis TaxID=1387779 RepID=A0A7X0RS13_9BACL|nr:hypothetical protein [Cohnella nanjingensis]MBB6672602.1 hypothetical protein [Cohnella nanjingensis]
MTNTVDKQALLKDMGDTLTAYIKLYQGANAAEVKSWMDAIRSGKYESAPPAERQADVYREALEWYANKENYEWNADDEDFFSAPWASVVDDDGERARQALSACPTTQPSGIREPVQWFAEQMEQTLRRNDHKGGWGACSDAYLWGKLEEEIEELRQHYPRYDRPGELDGIARDASDVANIVMMLADNACRPGINSTEGDPAGTIGYYPDVSIKRSTEEEETDD